MLPEFKTINMNKKPLLIALSAAILLIIVLAIMFTQKESAPEITAKVMRGPFEVLVYSTGQLETENSENILIPAVMNDRQTRISSLTITDLVDEGTIVDSGDYVATLDHQAVEEQLKLALDDMEKALSEFEDSKIDSNLTLSNQRDLIVNAQLDLEESEIAVKESAYEAPSVKRKVEMDLDKARRKLEQQKKSYQLVTQQEVNKVTRKFINYKQTLERVDVINRLKDALIIRAPRSGIISYFQYPFGGSVKTGSRVSQWNPIIATFPDMSDLVTKTFINEIDISLIKKGQKARIGIDAFPEKTLTGEVVAVANMGQLMPNSDAKVFEVRIKIDGTDPNLKPAMTTSNTISTNDSDSVLYVPIESVFSNDSLSYVYIAEGKKIRQIVETGDKNENFVVIKQGLTEGQLVLLNQPANANDYSLVGMEIYTDIIKKQAEEKANKAEEEKLQKQKKAEQLQNIPSKVPVSAAVLIK